MRTTLLRTLLLLSFFLYQAQGKRMGKVLSQTGFLEIQGEDGTLIDTSKEAIDCKDGKCKGRNRKLLPKIVSSSTTTINPMNPKNEKIKAESKSATNVSSKEEAFTINPSPVFGQQKADLENHREADSETYPDILDIAGMDYTPAKRKPPIHN